MDPMEAAKSQLIAEIGPLDGVEIEVIPTLIVGPMGDFCGACWETDACTVTLRWVASIEGVERELEFTLHRGCAPEHIRRMALYVPEMTVELGLYADNIDDTAHLSRPSSVPAAPVAEHDIVLPPCELEPQS